MRLWKPNGTPVATLKAHQGSLWHISFSPDSKMLASASLDRTLRLWNLDLDSLLIQGCDWVRDHLNTPPNDKEKEETKKLCDDIPPQ